MEFYNIGNIDNKKVLATLDEVENDPPRKRRRLDDLTTEERVLRRKLKNRVAAQTARDRKKARMSELEVLVANLEKENQLLRRSNDDLGKQISILADENAALKERLGITPPQSPAMSDHQYAATPTEQIVMPLAAIDNTTDVKPIVIKNGGAPIGHASPEFSLPKKARVLLLSLIIMWLRNPTHLTVFIARNTKKLRAVPQWKRLHQILSKLKNSSQQKSSKLLMRLCVSLKVDPNLLRQAVMGRELISSPSAKISGAWWGKRPLMKTFSPRGS